MLVSVLRVSPTALGVNANSSSSSSYHNNTQKDSNKNNTDEGTSSSSNKNNNNDNNNQDVGKKNTGSRSSQLQQELVIEKPDVLFFQSVAGKACVAAHLKVSDGALYPLKSGLFFLKPVGIGVFFFFFFQLLLLSRQRIDCFVDPWSFPNSQPPRNTNGHKRTNKLKPTHKHTNKLKPIESNPTQTL